MKLRKLACPLPNQLYFQYFILLLFSSPASSLPFHIFFSLLFSHLHTSSHTPRFPLFSVLNFLSSLSFYVVFLFLLLFSFMCIFFNIPMLHLIWLFFTSQSSFSPWFFCFAFFFFFFFVRYDYLFHLFLLLFFFGWDFSFTIQTLCQPNLEFQLIFTEGFLIERVRRGFLVWENDPIPKSKQCCIGKKNREESPKWCRLRLETKDPCEPLELVMVHRTGQSDRGPYGSLLFLYVTVLHV